jgi:phosphatidylglycerophosphatase A
VISLSKDKYKSIIGTAFFLGYLPVMPGTFGALPGIAIYYLLWYFLPSAYLLVGLLISIGILIFLTYYLTPWAVAYWKSEDPSQFILDEIIGFLFVPVFYQTGSVSDIAITGFILFRVFDIIKIPPANYVDKHIKGGTGIILDDIISAGYAALCLYLLSVCGFQFI